MLNLFQIIQAKWMTFCSKMNKIVLNFLNALKTLKKKVYQARMLTTPF